MTAPPEKRQRLCKDVVADWRSGVDEYDDKKQWVRSVYWVQAWHLDLVCFVVFAFASLAFAPRLQKRMIVLPRKKKAVPKPEPRYTWKHILVPDFRGVPGYYQWCKIRQA